MTPFRQAATAILIRVIEAQPTVEQRADFARIAHRDGNITDAQLARFEGVS
jgi:hypothetical protein